MLKIKKASPKSVQKTNKNIKKVGGDNPKQKKQQLEKVKKLVKAALELDKTPTKILDEEDDAPDSVEQSEVESDEEDEAPDAVEQSEVESDEEHEAQDAVEQSEAESDEEDDAPDAVEQSEVESDEEDDALDAVEQSEVESDEEDAPVAVKQSEVEKDAKGTKTANPLEGVGHTVLVSNLPAKTNRVQLVKLFAPYGKIMGILFSTSKGIIFTHTIPEANIQAYVVLDSIEAATKALDVNGNLLNGQRLIVKKPEEPSKFVSRTNEAETVVFVTNLGTNKKESLENFFSSCGKIKYINFIKNSDDKINAFVCFISPDAAKLALKLNGNILDERHIRVLKYVPNFNKTSTRMPLTKDELKNLDKEEFKQRMLKLGQKRIQQMQRNKFQGERNNSQFHGVKSGGIRKFRKF